MVLEIALLCDTKIESQSIALMLKIDPSLPYT